MTGGSAQANRMRVAGQLAGLVLGPLAWAGHQNLGHLLVPHACDTGQGWPFALLTVLALLVAGGAGLWSFLSAPRGEAPPEGPARRRHGRGRMLAAVSAGLAMLAVLGIAAEAVPVALLDPCEAVP